MEIEDDGDNGAVCVMVDGHVVPTEVLDERRRLMRLHDHHGPGGALAAVALTVWTFVALRRLHGESWLRTLVKTAALALSSLIALVAVMLATVLVTTLLT